MATNYNTTKNFAKVVSALNTISANRAATASKPSVITSNTGGVRDTTKTNLGELDRMTGIATTTATKETKPKVSDSYLKEAVDTYKANKSPLQQEYESEAEAYRTKLDRYKSRMDNRTNEQIDLIQQEYAALGKQQEIANKAYEGGVTAEGLVSGRERYAPSIQQGIVANAVRQGIGELEKITAKKNAAILAAEQARDERNFKLLNESMQLARTLAQDEKAAIQSTYENIQSAKKNKLEEETKYAELYAPAIASHLTGNPTTDLAYVTQEAIKSGNVVSPTVLYNTALKYQAEARKQAAQSLDPLIERFNFYKNQGGTMTFSEYAQSPIEKNTTGSGARTVEERISNKLSEYGSKFVVGARLPDGTPILDVNGFITPEAWKEALNDAVKNEDQPIPREDFIKQFGYLLYVNEDTGEISNKYGLTAREKKLITG